MGYLLILYEVRRLFFIVNCVHYFLLNKFNKKLKLWFKAPTILSANKNY